MREMAHPSAPRLLAYANGTLPDGLALLVASHLTYCPRCRDRVERLETLGGAFLASTEPAVAPPDRAAVLARIDAEEAPAAETPRDPVFPEPLRRILAGGADAIRWRFLLPGLSDHRLEGFEGEDVYLLRARPGARILSHTHEGEETTLVLSGALQDGDRVFRPGDVSEADASHDHRPTIIGDEVCICLVVMTGRMRFTGSVGRALNLFN
jgi:putative transcriptional regulator